MLRRLALLAFAAEFLKGGWSQTQRYERQAEQARQAGVPVTPEFVRACGWTKVGAPICLQLPLLRRPAALVLAGLLMPITYIGHRFWEMEDQRQRETHLTQVMKNTTMLGGALFIAASK